MRLINAKAVQQLLSPCECISLMKQAFVAVAEGRTKQPIRNGLPNDNGLGLVSWMPATLVNPDILGVKVLSVFKENIGAQFSLHQGGVILFDNFNGKPLAFVDAREITAIRTAAATAAATDVLARKNAKTLGLFGYGEQAHSHLQALSKVRNIEKCFIWGRDFAKAQNFAFQNSDICEIIAVKSPKEAASADILCLTTSSPTPYFQGEWLTDGQHLNAVGSSVPTTSEVDSETIARSKVYVDFEDSARALAGDIRMAIAENAIEENHIIGSVGDVIIGKKQGRTSESDITYFKSLGMAVEDLIAALYVFGQAKEKNLGVEIDW